MDLLEIFSYLINCALWYYTVFVFITIAVYLPILAAYYCSRTGTKFHYYLWKFVIMYAVLMLPGIIFPFFTLRPKNPMNIALASWFLRKINYITGLTWELRGANIAGLDEGMVVCCNHMSAVDIYGQISLWEHFKSMTAIAKKEMLYMIPFGPAGWLAGMRFVDRRNAKRSYETLSSVTKLMVEGKTKVWIYPEGTRNNKGGFLPFKKGAFYTAIEAQVPIMPIVIAPYYYMDEPNEKFLHEKKHNIFSVLDPIPTNGLTLDDVDALKDNVYSIMLAEYQNLKEEVALKSKDLAWVNKYRPRVTLTNRKVQKPISDINVQSKNK